MGNSNGNRSGTVGSFGSLKLDIPDRTIPHHLDRVSPDHSIFQTIILAPCKRHNRSIPSPKATVLNPPPAFKTGPPPDLPRELYSPSPFWVFRFCQRRSLPLPDDRISVLWTSATNAKRYRIKLQTFGPHRANSRRNLLLSTDFGARSSK
ncbi:hypothetical protein AVEN_38466-1 [Araneus ventricosus]|uniref:Uncharacterized protein n=1 Tax=Araneus ventricosus TaxID=182803 RepID=A0A4Y2H743_ARAVE|nr:hypothetical protein AVEN_38466-1 [Araneus ventricosus]